LTERLKEVCQKEVSVLGLLPQQLQRVQAGYFRLPRTKTTTTYKKDLDTLLTLRFQTFKKSQIMTT
jgi:hypothetical protein